MEGLALQLIKNLVFLLREAIAIIIISRQLVAIIAASIIQLAGNGQPSQRYSLTAGAGNNSFVTVYLSPMQRLNWTTTYS